MPQPSGVEDGVLLRLRRLLAGGFHMPIVAKRIAQAVIDFHGDVRLKSDLLWQQLVGLLLVHAAKEADGAALIQAVNEVVAAGRKVTEIRGQKFEINEVVGLL